jgi:HSP20 family protein
MSLVNWNQPTRLTSRRNWIENFFAETDDFFKDFNWDKSVDVPAVNVKEEENQYLVEVAAPGMKKEDFTIRMENNILMISAKTESSSEEKKDNFVRKEFNYRNFSRSFWMPENVDANAINAAYKDGVLTLTLPKLAAPVAAPAKSIIIA